MIGVDWSKADSSQICAVSKDGQVLNWNLSYNSCQIITLGKLTATCIVLSPHEKNLAAIGTKSGLIFIVNLQGSGTINWKLRGHDVEVTSLSWCPSALNHLGENKTKKDHLLASAAKDKKIYLWRAGGDGRYEAQIQLPSKPRDTKQHRSHPNSSTGIFTAVSWIEPNYLLANSWFGELLSINLSQLKTAKDGSNNCIECLHGSHNRGIFSIGTWIDPISSKESTESSDNWRVKKVDEITQREIWTIAQDRRVICCTMKNLKSSVIEHDIPTQIGYIYCIAACPLDTSRVAFGSGDSLLRLWNLSEPHETTFDLSFLWQKIMGRIITLAWHPVIENQLAFGSNEGRIGVYDTNKIQKEPILYRQHHRRYIYSLGWGPSAEKDNKYCLYSCGDGELVCWNPDVPSEKPKIIKPKNCTEFSWKNDFSCLAVGYEDGSIDFLDKKSQSMGNKMYLLKKPIQRFAWHPESTATDLEFSENKNYLAVATSSPAITILDMSNLLALKNENNQNEVDYRVVATLTGHVDRVFCLAWSPHLSGQLVSGSADGYAQVWNVNNQQLIATFNGHSAGVYSAMWSPLDANLIITGSGDFSLRVWKISEQKIALPPPKVNLKTSKASKKNLKKKNGSNEDSEKSTNSSVKDTASISLTDENQLIQKPQDKPAERKEKPKKIISYFPLYKKRLNEQTFVMSQIMKRAKKLNGLEVEENEDSLSLFGDKEEVQKIIDQEQNNHFTQGHQNASSEMNIWNGNLKSHLLKAAECKKLNDYMVSLAPSLSQKFWHEMCEAYANQLIQESNPAKAVAYLLSIHKIHQAIQVFVDVKMYKEAFAIAKCRLDKNDPMMTVFLDSWTKHAVKSGQFEDCAQIALISGDLSAAAVYLARKKDPIVLETAAELASMDKNEALSLSLADQAVIETISTGKYEKGREIISKFDSLEFRLIQIAAHEELKKKIQDENMVENWLQGTNYKYIESVKNKFKNLDKISWCYEKLGEKTYAVNSVLNDITLNLLISHDLALASAAPDDISSAKHLVAALAKIFQNEIFTLPELLREKLSIKLLTMLDSSLPSLKKSMFCCEKEGGIFKSLRAYLNVGLSTWLCERVKKTPVIEKALLDSAVDIIRKTLDDVVEEEILKFQMMMIKVKKYEETVLTEQDEEFIEKLNNIRKQIKEFTEERVSVPNPMVAFTKISELNNVLDDYDFEDSIAKCNKVIFASTSFK